VRGGPKAWLEPMPSNTCVVCRVLGISVSDSRPALETHRLPLGSRPRRGWAPPVPKISCEFMRTYRERAKKSPVQPCPARSPAL